MTCEGCKKFFRRGLKEADIYECKSGECCAVTPRNRNICRYCRYQKCMQVGMSREAIRMGRPRKSLSPTPVPESLKVKKNVIPKPSPGLICSQLTTRRPEPYIGSNTKSDHDMPHQVQNSKRDLLEQYWPQSTADTSHCDDAPEDIWETTTYGLESRPDRPARSVTDNEEPCNESVNMMKAMEHVVRENRRSNDPYQRCIMGANTFQDPFTGSEDGSKRQTLLTEPVRSSGYTPSQASQTIGNDPVINADGSQLAYPVESSLVNGTKPPTTVNKNGFCLFPNIRYADVSQTPYKTPIAQTETTNVTYCESVKKENRTIYAEEYTTHCHPEDKSTTQRCSETEDYQESMSQSKRRALFDGNKEVKSVRLDYWVIQFEKIDIPKLCKKHTYLIDILQDGYNFMVDASDEENTEIHFSPDGIEETDVVKRRIVRNLKATIKFADVIPGFAELTSPEKFALCRFGGFHMMIILVGRQRYDPLANTFKYFWSSPLPPAHPGYLLRQGLLKAGSDIHGMRLDQKEAACLGSLALICTDWVELQYREKLETLKKPIVEALLAYVQDKHGKSIGKERLKEIFAMMPVLRELSLWHGRYTDNFTIDVKQGEMSNNFNNSVNI